MTLVFEFAALYSPWSHGDGGMFALQGLDAGHLIGRHHPLTGLSQRLGFKVERGEISHFLICRLIWFRVEPIAASMRLEIDLILKNDRHGARKWSRQCLA